MNLFHKPIRNQETHYYHTAVAEYYKSTDKAVILRDIYNLALIKIDTDQLVDGLPWVYYSAASLNKRHKQMSVRTIKRYLSDFEQSGMLFSRGDLNKFSYDKTKSYTVNFAYYNSMFTNTTYKEGEKWLKALQTLIGQNGPSVNTDRDKMAQGWGQNGPTNTLNLPEPIKNSSKELSKVDSPMLFNEEEVVYLESQISNKENLPSKKVPRKKVSIDNGLVKSAIEVIEFLNECAGRKFPSNPDGEGPANGTNNIKLVLKLYRKVHNFEDIKDMVLLKCYEWKGNVRMKTYLQPSTIFGREKSLGYVQSAIEARNNPEIKNMIDAAKEKQRQQGETIGGNVTASTAARIYESIF